MITPIVNNFERTGDAEPRRFLSRDGTTACQKFRSRQIAEGMTRIRVGLEEQRLDPTCNAPSWLHALSSKPPLAAQDDGRSSERLTQPCISKQTRLGKYSRLDADGCKIFCSDFPHIFTTHEHHIRPPQYDWCGPLNRNAYPKEPEAEPEISRMLSTINAVPYYESFDKRLRKTPAEKLRKLVRNAQKQDCKICLDERISPDALRENFYALLEAFDLEAPEQLLAIMGPSETNGSTWKTGSFAGSPSNKQLLRSLAMEISKEKEEPDSSLLYDVYRHAWNDLQDNGRLKESPSQLGGTFNSSIAAVINNFRLTLPPNKRGVLPFWNAFCSHRRQLCGICKQFYCEGHFDQPLPRPVISCSQVDMAPRKSCGQECSLLKTDEWMKTKLNETNHLKFENWDRQSRHLLLELKQEFESESSGCNLVKLFQNPSRTCWQIWIVWSTAASKPSGSNSPPSTTESSKKRARPASPDWTSLPPVETQGYVPCAHSAGCSGNEDCTCHKQGTYCDRFCQCSETCSRRYKGCKCRKSCDENCECVQNSRECDPHLCRCPACEMGNHEQSSGSPMTSTDQQLNAKKITFSSYDCGNFLISKKKKRTFVAPSKIAGLGLFAGENISCGDYLGQYTGVFLRAEDQDVNSLLTRLSSTSYLFDLNQVDMIDSKSFGNRTRFINEAATGKQPNASPSVWYVAGSQIVRFFASRRIKVGEEITIHYGSDYHVRDW